MSWDYNYNFANIQVQAPFDKNQVELSAQLSDVQKTSFSSASSESTASSAHRRSMATDYVTDSEMESKLLPQNLWGDSKSLASATAHTAAVANRANTIEEQRFLQSQLSGPDLWYSSDYTQPTVSAHDVGSSASSVFDMKMNSHPHPPRTQVSTPASSNTPNSLSHYGLSGMSSFQGIVSPATASSPLVMPSSMSQQQSQPQMASQQQQQQQQQGIHQFTQQGIQQPLPQGGMPQITTAQLLNNTQNMLQSYQQQQVYLEQLQQQQQQIMQNPLFLQQQAQLVSQQLQQLQLQLQLQQQQIESLNAKKLESDKLPLTEENLTKLQQSPTEKNAQANNNQNNTQNNNNNNNNTTTQAKSSHSSENKSTVNTELYKTELCTTFLKSGSCPYGNKCQFAHGENELKVVERGSKWRSKPCANWTKTGSCRYGNRCCFKHE